MLKKLIQHFYRTNNTDTSTSTSGYGSDWSDRAILAVGLKWAPENLIIPEDITLKDGTVLRKGKRFFSWYEAIALAAENKLPKGWRLPTADELRQLHDKTGLKFIIRTLSLGLNGWIASSNMDEYNADPENFADLHGQGSYGLYWSSTAYYANYAYVFRCDSDCYVCVGYDTKNVGNLVRCVAQQ